MEPHVFTLLTTICHWSLSSDVSSYSLFSISSRTKLFLQSIMHSFATNLLCIVLKYAALSPLCADNNSRKAIFGEDTLCSTTTNMTKQNVRVKNCAFHWSLTNLYRTFANNVPILVLYFCLSKYWAIPGKGVLNPVSELHGQDCTWTIANS